MGARVRSAPPIEAPDWAMSAVDRKNPHSTIGEVAKRSNAADCKSVAPEASKVRVLPSPPTFRSLWSFGWRASRGEGERGLASEGEWMLRLISRNDVLTGSRKRHDAGLRAEAPGEREKARREGGSNSVVESQPSKLLVAGSIPVSRSSLRRAEEVAHRRRGQASAGTRADSMTEGRTSDDWRLTTETPM